MLFSTVQLHESSSLAFLVTVIVCGTAAAGWIASSPNKYYTPDRSRPEPNFHVVLERVGKTVLRPGGSRATDQLQKAANLSKGDSVLELSAGLGTSSIAVAQKYGCHVLLTDIDEARLGKAKERVEKLGLSDNVRIQKLDMFAIERTLGKDAVFDCAMTEASLTHYPLSRKVQFFKGIANHASKFLLHEICFTSNSKEAQAAAKSDMSKVLNIGFMPETADTWMQLLEDSGYTIDFMEVGNLAVLNPLNVIQDEGPVQFGKIAANLATQPYLRSRMLATRRTISSHKDDLGYITICASKSP